MSSLSNQQGNSKSLTGLSDDYSSNIVTNTLEVIDEFTVDTGGVINLPANSIQDSYLSSNVALLNRITQVFTGQNYFSANTTLSNGAFLYLIASTGGTQTRLRQSTTGFDIINMNISQSINFQTRTAGNVLVIGFQCQNGNTAFMQGDLNNRITISGALTPTISTQAPALSNDLSIANTSWVNTKLGAYALLTPTANPQVFTGNQKFQNSGANLPISIGSTSAGITSIGGLFVSDGAGSYNASVGLNDLVLISTGTGNGTGTLTLTSWSNTPVGLKISPTSSTFVGSVNVPTQLTTDNSTLVASTAYVKNQGYASLAGTQTFTGVNTFSNLTVHNATLRNFQSTQAVFPGDFRLLDSTQTYLTQMYQVGTTCIIDAPFASSRFSLSTRDALNTGLTNLLMENKNHVVLQGSASEIDILGTAVSLNGVCSFTNTTTPTITQAIATADNSTKIPTTAWVRLQGYSLLAPTTQTFTGNNNFPTQLTTDNSTLVATTAYVKNQGYLIASDLTPYALLTPVSNPQIFTGQQRFTSSGSNLPISVASTTGAITGGGGLFVATTAGQYNPIVKGNDCVLVGTGSAIDSASTKLTLTTYASSPVGIQMDIGNMTFDGGIIRQNSNFNCGYSYLATPGTIKGFYDIGYVWTIPYASFTGGAWATSAVVYNILTLPWDGTGNKRLGVWKVDVVIINTCTSAPSSSLCWNTVSNVSRTINDTCVGASDLFLFGATGCQIMRMSFTINVVNLTTTYYLNSLTGGGAGLASNTASQITFTRIA